VDVFAFFQIHLNVENHRYFRKVLSLEYFSDIL